MTSMEISPTLRSRSNPSRPARPARKETRTGGIAVERWFTKEGVDVYDTCEWDTRSAVIANERGENAQSRPSEGPQARQDQATHCASGHPG